MSLSKFPILQLPNLAFEQILQSMRYIEIIQFSQCSKASKSRIQALSHLWKNTGIKLQTYGFSKSVHIENPTEPLFNWWFHMDSHHEPSGNHVQKDIKIDDMEFRVCEYSNNSFESHAKSPDDCVLFLVKFFSELFSNGLSMVAIKMEGSFFDFDRYFVKTTLLHDSFQFFIDDCGLSHEEMSFMLDTFKTTNFLCQGYPGKTFRHPRPICFPTIQIGNAFWVDSEMLENLATNSELIRIGDSILTSEKINEFIKKWLDSGDSWKMRDLTIRNQKYSMNASGRRNPLKLYKDQILEGLQTKKGSKKEPGNIEYLESTVEYEKGVDIERKDGVIATIHFYEGEDVFDFMMTVWFEK